MLEKKGFNFNFNTKSNPLSIFNFNTKSNPLINPECKFLKTIMLLKKNNYISC